MSVKESVCVSVCVCVNLRLTWFVLSCDDLSSCLCDYYSDCVIIQASYSSEPLV